MQHSAIQSLISIDTSVVLWFQHSRTGVLDFIMYAVTTLGEMAAVWIALALLALIADKGRGKRVFLCVVAALILSEILIVGFHHSWMRERPYLVLPGIIPLGHHWHNTAFPSGHASSCVAAGLIYIQFYRQLTAPVIAFMLLTLVSRVYLGFHYPSDVLVGALLGVASYLIVKAVALRRNKDFFGRN